jgi:hypothetical protein
VARDRGDSGGAVVRALIRLGVAGAAFAAAAVAMPAYGTAAGGGSCYPVNFTWICVYSHSGGGSPGSGDGTDAIACTYTKASAGVLQRAGVGPPEPGHQWDFMTCPGSILGPLGGKLVQVSIRTGTPAINPFELFKIAIRELSVPTLPGATAPPRGKDALVGLPEWYWVPRGQWHSVSITVHAGPVWATASAVPTSLSFVPGGGLGSVACRGPGTPFIRSKSAAQEQTNCSYTYAQASKGQPGNAFQAGLFVTWTISWTGSGGAGGLITDSYSTGSAFPVRVAQAQALVTTP